MATIPLHQSLVWFKATCNFTKKHTPNFYYSLNGKDWTALGTALKMAYSTPHFMGYRFGLFNYASKEVGGIADFEYFRVREK